MWFAISTSSFVEPDANLEALSVLGEHAVLLDAQVLSSVLLGARLLLPRGSPLRRPGWAWSVSV